MSITGEVTMNDQIAYMEQSQSAIPSISMDTSKLIVVIEGMNPGQSQVCLSISVMIQSLERQYHVGFPWNK